MSCSSSPGKHRARLLANIASCLCVLEVFVRCVPRHGDSPLTDSIRRQPSVERVSEPQLEGELNHSRSSPSPGDLAERRIHDVALGIAKRRRVRDVVCLGAKLQRGPFGQARPFRYAHVHSALVGTNDYVAPQVAELSPRKRHGVRIQVIVYPRGDGPFRHQILMGGARRQVRPGILRCEQKAAEVAVDDRKGPARTGRCPRRRSASHRQNGCP